MPKYRVVKTSFIDNRIVQPGEEVEYEGLVGDNLEPMDKEGKKVAAESAAISAKEVADIQAKQDLTTVLTNVLNNAGGTTDLT